MNGLIQEYVIDAVAKVTLETAMATLGATAVNRILTRRAHRNFMRDGHTDTNRALCQCTFYDTMPDGSYMQSIRSLGEINFLDMFDAEHEKKSLNELADAMHLCNSRDMSVFSHLSNQICPSVNEMDNITRKIVNKLAAHCLSMPGVLDTLRSLYLASENGFNNEFTDPNSREFTIYVVLIYNPLTHDEQNMFRQPKLLFFSPSQLKPEYYNDKHENELSHDGVVYGRPQIDERGLHIHARRLETNRDLANRTKNHYRGKLIIYSKDPSITAFPMKLPKPNWQPAMTGTNFTPTT